jgi:hypothetical protein
MNLQKLKSRNIIHKNSIQTLIWKDLNQQEAVDTDMKSIRLEEPKLTGGRWQFVIGLVVSNTSSQGEGNVFLYIHLYMRCIMI